MEGRGRVWGRLRRLLAFSAVTALTTWGLGGAGAAALPGSSTPSGSAESTEAGTPIGEEAVAAEGAPGALDPTFDLDGRVESDLTTGDDYVRDAVIQPDGKVVAVGELGGSGGRWGVLRYRTDGTLDPTFSGDGWAAVNFSNGWDEAAAVALQADGRVVVAGYASPGRIGLARFRTNGTLDPTFSGDGRAIVLVGTTYAGAYGVVVQPNGRIVVGGTTGGSGGRILVARFLATGALDRSFSADGWAALNLSPREDFLWDVALQPNGSIVGVGVARGGANATDYTALAVRYRANGSLDPTFSLDGRTTVEHGPLTETGTGVAVAPDGRIVIAGSYGTGSAEMFLVARLLANGSLDPAFGTAGRTTTDFTTGSDYAWDLALQDDGRLVVAGVSRTGSGAFGLARYEADGSPDATFGVGGRVETDFTSDLDGALAVAVQGDGRIVAAGGSGGEPGRLALARYLG